MIATTSRYQKGMSLLELMISLTLGLIIAAALIALFLNSKQSYLINDSMSRLQENARFAVSFLSRDLRMADYRACVTDDRLDNAIGGANGSGLNGSDTVTIIWQSNACDAAGSTVTTTYSIQTGSGGNPALFRTINGVSQELVEGIENLQILYGEDTDDDLVPNYYVDAASITDMKQAISVRFTLMARTLEDNVTTSGNKISRAFTSVVTLRNRLP